MTVLLPVGTLAPAPSRRRRPLALLAALGGLAAAAGPLTVCLAFGVIGWFVTDSGAHGAPRDGLWVGAVGWLTAHGSGLTVEGARVTVLPLLITLMSAHVTWRFGRRVGEALASYGPDAEGAANGARDLTVPLSTAIFAGAYGAVIVLVATVTGANLALVGGLSLSVGLGGTGIAVGSGRAAVWTAALPLTLRAAWSGSWRILINVLLAAGALFAASMVLHADDAATMASGIRADAGDSVLYWLAALLVVPNAVLLTASYLTGAGFALGAHTVVSPTAVVLGPLPLVPWFAGLPEAGAGSDLTRGLLLLPVLIALGSAARAHLRYPTASFLDGALRAAGSGMLAATWLAALIWLAGGSAGPGRMRYLGGFVFDAWVSGLAMLGVGALVGGLAMTWWWRRSLAAPH